MSHKEQMSFIESVRNRFPNKFNQTEILEVGSYNINGTVRDFFTEPVKYIGLDLAPGNGVDIVCPGNLFESETPFDVCISSECFEHDENWIDTFKNMYKLCKEDGLIVVTCATYNRPEHGTKKTSPTDSLSSNFSDYYKNLSIRDFIDNFVLEDMFSNYSFEINVKTNDLYFWAIKKEVVINTNKMESR